MRIPRKNIAVASVGVAAALAVLGTLLFVGSNISTRTIPKGSIEISTPYNKYLLGEEIKFTIKNNFNSTISFKNACPTEPLDVYRYENNTWQKLHATTSIKNCTFDNRTIIIPANSAKEASLANWQGLFDKPGTYRIVAYVDYYGLLPYTDFEIIQKPIIPTIPVPQTQATAKSTSQSASSLPTASTNTSSMQATTSNPTTTATTPTPTATPARTSKTINLTEGIINVEYTSTTIYIMSILPSSGYTYERSRNGPSVEITFKRNGNETQVKLTLSNGQLIVRYND